MCTKIILLYFRELRFLLRGLKTVKAEICRFLCAQLWPRQGFSFLNMFCLQPLALIGFSAVECNEIMLVDHYYQLLL